MSGSYKIIIIAALLLCGGIVTYHLIQEKDTGITDTIVTPEPIDRKKIQSNSSPLQNTPDEPGIGDLMSKLRNHIETVEKTTPAQNDSPINNRQKTVHTDSTTRLIEPKADPQPQTPTLTFGPTPNDVAVVAAIDNTPHEKTPAVMTQQPTDRNDTPTHSSPTPKTSRNYTIQTGDTFSSIAVKIYGSQKHWIDIAMANPFLDPKKLQVGQSVRLPDIDEVQIKTKKTIDGQPSIKPTRTHIVRPGESLYSIADHYYENADLWRIIFDANQTTLGANPDQLEVGEILKIPPAPENKP